MIEHRSVHIVAMMSLLLAGVILVNACGSSRPYSLDPVKTFDPDNRDIPPPAESEENFSWETLYLSTFYQLEKPLDLGWTFRKAGRLVGWAEPDEAENVNVLDEVPNSSWYTRRHYFEPMSTEALRQGPNKAGGPDTSQVITVIRGKSEGVTPGFTIRDARGDTYVIKLDNPDFPELSSSSEVISTQIYYASGYFTPQNSIAYLDPAQLVVGEDATVTKKGVRQPMTRADLDTLLAKAYKQKDGKLRVLASKYVEGKPLGPWSFLGTREDDPNDRIPHEDRRELRGLRVLASWLNDTDRRKANTLASYVEENGNRYLRHYLIDMGSTLGTTGTSLRHTKRGQEYRYDLRYMALLYSTLGFYIKPWEQPEAKDRPFYPAVGYFESQIFNPAGWVTSYPNPAFEKVTPRDGFWGAKLTMAFSDQDIRAIVESAQLSNSDAQEYLIKVLKERRDKIGRYWFRQVNPLDKFEVRRTNDRLILTFIDLAVDGSLFSASETSYRYTISGDGKQLAKNEISHRSSIEFPLQSFDLDGKNDPKILEFQIYTLRDGKVHPEKKINVYVAFEGEQTRVVGLKRED